MKSLSVLVADHHPLFAEGIRTVLASPGNAFYYQVHAIARNAEQVEGYLNEYPTDLLLVDPNLPMGFDLDMLGRLKAKHPYLKVVFLTNANDPIWVQRALKSGLDGYLLKTASKDELRSAIREIAEGRTFIGRGVQNMPSEARPQTDQATQQEVLFIKKYGLTKREMEIIRYIGQALTNKEIGDRIFISDQTVSVHRKNIMRKLRVNSTASLIKTVFEHQLPLVNN